MNMHILASGSELQAVRFGYVISGSELQAVRFGYVILGSELQAVRFGYVILGEGPLDWWLRWRRESNIAIIN
jgi:hypothetical protein